MKARIYPVCDYTLPYLYHFLTRRPTILFHLFSSFLFFLFFFLSFFSSFFFFRYNSTTRILSSTWIPIVPPAAPLFFLPSFFYLELLIYRGHWRGSRRSVKSLNVMRCYYLRGRRLSKSGSGKVVMHTQRCYIHGAYTYSSLRRGRFLGRCRKTRDSTLV